MRHSPASLQKLCLTGLACLLLFGALASSAQQAQEAASADNGLSIETLEARIAVITNDQKLDAELKAKVSGVYTSALEQLRIAADRQQKAQLFEQDRLQAPDRLKEIEAALAKAPELPEDLPEKAAAVELNQLLVQAEVELAEAVKQRDELLAEPARRADRRKQVPDLIAEATRRIEEAQQQLAMPADTTMAPELYEAHKILAQARLKAAQAEKEACEKELRSYEARGQLLIRRQDAAARALSLAEKRAVALRERLNTVRAEEGQAAVEQAEEASAQVAESSPVVRKLTEDLAAENNKLIAARTGASGISERITRETGRLELLREELKELKEAFSRLEDAVNKKYVRDAVGVLLREQRERLRAARMKRHEVLAALEGLEKSESALLGYQRERQDLADIPALVAECLQEQEPLLKAGEKKELERLLSGLYEAKRASLDALIAEYNSYIDLLLQLQVLVREYTLFLETFSDFVEKHILWIRSANRFDGPDLKALIPALAWSFEPQAWKGLARSILRDAMTHPLIYTGVILLLALAFLLRFHLQKKLTAYAAAAEKATCLSFEPTLRSFCALSIAAVILPAPLLLLYGRLYFLAGSDPFLQGLSSGLAYVGLFLLSLELMRYVVRKHGLGEAHFGWAIAPLQTLRRPAFLLLPLLLLLIFLFAMCEWCPKSEWNDALGRLAFCLTMAIALFFGDRLFRPAKGALSVMLIQRFNRKLLLPYFGYALFLSLPVVLSYLSLTGFHYTALRLGWRSHGAFVFGFGVLVLHGLISRWLLLNRRRMAMDQARKRREARKQQAETEGEIAIEPELLDLAKVDLRTQRLVRWIAILVFFVGFFSIWAGRISLIERLDNVHLWQTTQQVSERFVDEAGNEQERIEERIVWVTLRHLGLALLIVVFTLVLFRNLPDLLEVTFLHRQQLGMGERYAITTIIGYGVFLIGALSTFNILGVGWGKVQWLVAALGVGLGFGLQEIFANFFSGLILLFERPIRVGDTVTIGGVDGYVSRIRLRATRIIDWDRKELIVPNKEFISGQLINWTLSDQILRIIIPVGIAYGSDTGRAYELLHRIAADHPDVLEDPKPQVFFLRFGESSLDFELRVFCPHIDLFMRIRHELHMAIDAAFREAGIEIAFPQRDIHIRTTASAPENPFPGAP